MTSEIDRWLETLEHHGCEPQGSRDRGWKAKCPAHQDANPSLSVSVGRDGKILVKCFAGCTFNEVRAALGIGAAVAQDAPIRAQRPVVAPDEPKPTQLPTGPIITPYLYPTADGAEHLAVLRYDPPDAAKYFRQWWRVEGGWIPKAPPAPLPLYRLAELLGSDKRVTVVEGEKCAEAVKAAWPGQLVTTWAGGTNAWQKTDWTPLKGREVGLVADGDEPGHKAMLALAMHLSGLSCRVKVALPQHGTGDIADWIAYEGKAGAGAKVAAMLTDYAGDEDSEEAAAPVALDNDVLRENEHYRLLGLAGDSVAIRIAAGRVLYRTRESCTQPATLIAIAPLHFWMIATGSPTLGAAQARNAGDGLLREADRIGQVDLTKMAGRGAVQMDDGEVVYHLGDRLLVDGQETDGLVYRDRIWLAEPRVDLAPPCSDAALREIAAAVMGYRWLTPQDGRRFLGWIASAIVGGALEWRPHAILNAPSSVGKSWLMREVLRKIMGPLVHTVADATPAAISRLTASSGLAIAVDEAEPTHQWIQELMAQLRIASGSEGMRIRADQTSTGVSVQMPRFSAILSSVATTAMGTADASRLTMVRLGEAVEDWPAVRQRILSAMEAADGARTRIVQSAGRIVEDARALTADMQDGGMDSREALASGVLTVGWRFWGLDDREVFAGADEVETPDASRALLDIMALRVRIDATHEQSVLETLNRRNGADKLADLYGIKTFGDCIAILPKHRGLAQTMGRTMWAATDLTRLLTQIEGVEHAKNPLHFGGIRARPVIFPREVLDEIGIDLWTEGESDDSGA